MLVVSTVYVSEAALRTSLQALATTDALLLSCFSDAAYERSSYCIGGTASEVRAGVLSVVRAAVGRLDMRQHSGTHPMIGVVDHVSVNPVGSTAMSEAGAVARSVAEDLPVRAMLYGAAHPDGRSLAETRRETTYFKSKSSDEGVCCCGASTHVLNYNMRVEGGEDSRLAKTIAAAVRSRGGEGLPGVEALALKHHGTTYEVACNLLDVGRSPPSAVLAKARAKVVDVGLVPEEILTHDYVIGLTMDQIDAILVRGETEAISDAARHLPEPFASRLLSRITKP